MNNPRIGIINAGAWGTAMAKNLAEKGYFVSIWDPLTEVVEDINRNNTNSRFLLGVDLPKSILASSTIEDVVGEKDIILFATPSMYILNTLKSMLHVPNIREGKSLIGVLTKGFLPGNRGPKLLLESMENYLPGFYKDNLVYISGPSHAEEVARKKLTGLISASANGKNAIRIREVLTSPSLMVFSSFDAIGVQTCGAVKNVIAIGFGILDSLMEFSESFGDNTESLLLAAGLNEIQMIGRALGSSHDETFTSIAGVGDLDVTCRSIYGRNRRFGKEIVLGRVTDRFNNIAELIENIDALGYLPEGAIAAKYVQELAALYDLKLPICDAVYRILNKEIDPLSAVRTMLHRLTGITGKDFLPSTPEETGP